MSVAFALKLSDIEADISLAEGATKECFDCDPDNPRAVARSSCRTCGGSGRQALAIVQIVEELSASRREADSGGESEGDDLYLEY